MFDKDYDGKVSYSEFLLQMTPKNNNFWSITYNLYICIKYMLNKMNPPSVNTSFSFHK